MGASHWHPLYCSSFSRYSSESRVSSWILLQRPICSLSIDCIDRTAFWYLVQNIELWARLGNTKFAKFELRVSSFELRVRLDNTKFANFEPSRVFGSFFKSRSLWNLCFFLEPSREIWLFKISNLREYLDLSICRAERTKPCQPN